MLKSHQKCLKLYSNISWMQASYFIKHFGSHNYCKGYSTIPLHNHVSSCPNLLQVCSQCITPFSNNMRYKSHHSAKPRSRFNGGGNSAHIYAKKFLAGGMVEPKLPWMTVTGQPKAKKKENKSTGGNTTSRRLKVLDQAFFDAITDLMASADLGERLAGKGLVITKVRVQDRLSGIQVFWTQTAGDLSLQTTASEVNKPCKITKEGKEEGIEDLLKWAAPILRQELANQRVVGCTVPHINFKKDVAVHNSMEVERILVRVREEIDDADERADAVAKRQRELLLEQQRRLQVPDAIFAPDFVYRPVYYDAANLPHYSGKMPRSRFTPFAPLGKGIRTGPKSIQIESSPEIDALLAEVRMGYASSPDASYATNAEAASAAEDYNSPDASSATNVEAEPLPAAEGNCSDASSVPNAEADRASAGEGNSSPDASSATDAEAEPASAGKRITVMRLRKSTPQHGILLQNNVYGICRDRIMVKIAAAIERMKEYKSVTNADANFPFALTLRLPSGEPETSEPAAVEHFQSKSSLQSWAYKYTRKTVRSDSFEKQFMRKSASKQAELDLIEQESRKYDAFEEELYRATEVEDYWEEPEEKL